MGPGEGEAIARHAGNDVHVQMEDGLTGVRARQRLKGHPGRPELLDRGTADARGQLQACREILVGGREGVVGMDPGDDQCMPGRRGEDVHERDRAIGLGDPDRRNPLRDDPAEEAVGHAVMLSKCPGRPARRGRPRPDGIAAAGNPTNVPSARAGYLRSVSAFSDPRWFDREAAVEREDVVCRAVPQADGGYLRAAETQSGGHLSVATFRICEGPLTGHHAGLLLWPPRNAADRERALGALADTPDERLEERLAETAVRCRVETSPFGELEVRKVLEIAPACELPPPAGPNPPIVREDVLPPQPPEAPATRIMVLRDAEQVREAVAQLAEQPVLGFDIETACTRLPPDQREERGAFDPWNGTVRLVQIAAPLPDGGAVAVVVDCWEVDPAPLLRLLGDGRRVLAHNAKFEQSWVKYRWDIELTDILDTCAWWTVIAGHLAAADFAHGLEDAKLVTLADRFLHAELDKTFQTSDWAQEVLSDGQLEYAGVDAAVLLPLADILEELGEELGCAEQARLASMAGGRRAAIATHYAAGRHDDERHEALAMVASAASTADLAAAGAIMRRMVLSAASRAAVAEAYKLRRSQLAA